MYHRFYYYNAAAEMLDLYEEEGAKLVAWWPQFIVFVPKKIEKKG